MHVAILCSSRNIMINKLTLFLCSPSLLHHDLLLLYTRHWPNSSGVNSISKSSRPKEYTSLVGIWITSMLLTKSSGGALAVFGCWLLLRSCRILSTDSLMLSCFASNSASRLKLAVDHVGGGSSSAGNTI